MLISLLFLFEYGVILNGSQTLKLRKFKDKVFEYGVILNGSQTETPAKEVYAEFEYGVILNGSQTPKKLRYSKGRV